MSNQIKTCIFNFEITSYCNADCPSCFRTLNKNHLSLNHLSVDDFEFLILNNIKFLKNSEYDKLFAKFCGEVGDPLLHPNIDQLISIAETVFDRVEIYTNGGVRNSKWIKNILSKHKKTRFIFGIDGLTNEINQIYRVNVKTNLALKNMIESSKHGYTRWDYTIFNHNFHELPKVLNLVKKYNIDLLCRFNGREFNKLDIANIVKCEKTLKENKISYYICK